jgi:hypothetical protein
MCVIIQAEAIIIIIIITIIVRTIHITPHHASKDVALKIMPQPLLKRLLGYWKLKQLQSRLNRHHQLHHHTHHTAEITQELMQDDDDDEVSVAFSLCSSA